MRPLKKKGSAILVEGLAEDVWGDLSKASWHTRGRRSGCNRRTKGRGSDGTLEERAMVLEPELVAKSWLAEWLSVSEEYHELVGWLEWG